MQDTLSFEEFTALERRNKLSQQKAERILKFRAMNGGIGANGSKSKSKASKRSKGQGGGDEKGGGEQGVAGEEEGNDDAEEEEDDDDDALLDSDSPAPSGKSKTNYAEQLGDAIESSGFQFVVTAMIVSLLHAANGV